MKLSEEQIGLLVGGVWGITSYYGFLGENYVASIPANIATPLVTALNLNFNSTIFLGFSIAVGVLIGFVVHGILRKIFKK